MPRQISANTAAIATGHPLGAAAGIEMLEQGGNAVDAAVAAMIALSVVIPGSVGLGGFGGSAVIRIAKPRSNVVVAVDFDSCAPLGFRNGLVTVDPESNQYGARSVTVPAVVAGLDQILRNYGTKPWCEVSQPAIRLAEEGFEFDSEHKRYLDRCSPKFDRSSLASLFPDGALPEVGDRWQQPDLARILRRLSEDGPGSFYEGDIAQSIVRFLRDRGGILTDEDFREYRPRVVEPVCVTLSGRPRRGQLQFYTPPPPSGGITSLAIVQTLERLGLRNVEPWGAQYFHLLSETLKLCWQERHLYLGDPEFVSVPMQRLVSEQAAEARAEQIRTGTIIRGHQAANQSPHTGNVIAIDGDGNMISLTATQGQMYGAHLVVDGMGLVLNHGMSRFDYTPSHPNAPAAGKRMQHNMSPMIALDNGQPAIAIGMPGGPKIVSVTAQLIIDATAFNATAGECVAAPRMHTDGDEPLQVSQHMPASVIDELEKLGHAVRREEDMGGPVNVLVIDPQTRKFDIASGEGTGAVAGI